MQHGLLYLSIYTCGFSVPAILDTGATWLFMSHKLAAKLPAIVQTWTPLTIMLPMGKTMVATSAIQLDMLVDDFIYTQYCHILPLANPLILGNDFCISYRITLDLA